MSVPDIHPVSLLLAVALPTIVMAIPATLFLILPALRELKVLHPDVFESVEGHLVLTPAARRPRKAPLKFMVFLLGGQFRYSVRSESLMKKLTAAMWIFRFLVPLFFAPWLLMWFPN